MAETPTFQCASCGHPFQLPQATLDRFPGWVPKICLPCKKGTPRNGDRRPRTPGTRSASQAGRIEENLTLEQVLAKYPGGPFEGVFTDGACSGNPGPGGWGVVHVRDNQPIDQRHGHAPQTTNNRMELTALIEAYEMLPATAEATIYTDSQLCVKTINEWAKGWKARGWRRKGGEIKNLELVQRAYQLAQQHPGVELRWIKAHNGSRWNEYADSLATAFMREAL